MKHFNIHDIINARGWVQECDNAIGEIRGRKKPYSETDRVMYALVSLYYEGFNAYIEEQNVGQYYCEDCSHDYGRPVYHKYRYPFREFKEKHARYLKDLNELERVL